ncbi:MAG: NF038122 family metalloprotease [Tepidisphaeraceae bacterium]
MFVGSSGARRSAQNYTVLHNDVVYPLTSPSTVSTSGNLGTFNIVISPAAGLSSNTAALAAFNRAAQQWAAYISDPITVTINADLSTIQPGGGTFPVNVIGSTSSVGLSASYNTIRNQLVTDAAGQPASANNGIVASLPTAAQFTAFVPSGRSLNGSVVLSKASAKAAGFTGLDGTFGVSDANIVFNSAFTFDFDNSDGVSAGTMDFETVAAHEIGHALGFSSNVDLLDQTTAASVPSFAPTTLDLFRFGRLSNNPTNASQFTTLPRNLVPNADVVTDDAYDEYAMSTGVAQGDGRQASHWKDDALSGTFIGAMDPTLSFSTVQHLTYADARALDLIGWDMRLWTPGDADHNMKVEFADLLALAAHYNLAGKWVDGDFNLDGTINFSDLLLLASNYGTVVSANSGGAITLDAASAQLAPEPSSLAMLVAAMLPALRRRR